MPTFTAQPEERINLEPGMIRQQVVEMERNPFDIFKNDIYAAYHEANEHKGYNQALNELKGALNYIEKAKGVTDQFERVSMQAGLNAAQDVIDGIMQKMEIMHDEVKQTKEAKYQAKKKAQEEITALIKKLKLDAQMQKLLQTIEEIEDQARALNINPSSHRVREIKYLLKDRLFTGV